MKIENKYLTINKYSRPGTKRSKTTKIAWHYIGNPGTSAIANRNYFNNAPNHKTYASSHYIIGLTGEIIACIPEGEIAYTTNSANSYSIGIEMCHPDNSGKFNQATYDAAVELGVDLCKRYKLDPLKDFIRHYDVTKKICPKYWVDNPSKWEQFKKDVYNRLNNKEEIDMNKLVVYFGDADVFAAIIVAQKHKCPVMKKSDFDASGLNIKEIIQIGGKKEDTDRFVTVKNACKYL